MAFLSGELLPNSHDLNVFDLHPSLKLLASELEGQFVMHILELVQIANVPWWLQRRLNEVTFEMLCPGGQEVILQHLLQVLLIISCLIRALTAPPNVRLSSNAAPRVAGWPLVAAVHRPRLGGWAGTRWHGASGSGIGPSDVGVALPRLPSDRLGGWAGWAGGP